MLYNNDPRTLETCKLRVTAQMPTHVVWMFRKQRAQAASQLHVKCRLRTKGVCLASKWQGLDCSQSWLCSQSYWASELVVKLSTPVALFKVILGEKSFRRNIRVRSAGPPYGDLRQLGIERTHPA